MQLRTVCDKRVGLIVPITSVNFEAKISIDIQQTLGYSCAKYVNLFWRIEDWTFAKDFLRHFTTFSYVISKNVKSHVF